MTAETNQKINEFFQRIYLRKAQYQNALPDELKNLINLKEFQQIYDYLIDNQAFFTERLQEGKPCRFAKERTGLSRTFNLIRDAKTGDILFILETKNKNKHNLKNPKPTSFSGSSKTTKVAWRIDSDKPQKMANAVYYISVDSRLSATKKEAMENALTSEAEKEAGVAQNLIKLHPEAHMYINTPTLGKIINKSGSRKLNNESYTKKMSFYAPWADCGSLHSFLKTDEGKSLSTEQKDKMALHLVMAVGIMHYSGCLHQDIKPDNILVYRDETGNYRLELADFGKAYQEGQSVIGEHAISATLGYESPEMAAFFNNPKLYGHGYYYNRKHASYGRDIGEFMPSRPEYAVPSKANDMWAVGIVLHELYNQKVPTVQTQSQFSFLIESLLQVNRENRYTADQAITYLLDAQFQTQLQAKRAAQAQLQAQALSPNVFQVLAQSEVSLSQNQFMCPNLSQVFNLSPILYREAHEIAEQGLFNFSLEKAFQEHEQAQEEVPATIPEVAVQVQQQEVQSPEVPEQAEHLNEDLFQDFSHILEQPRSLPFFENSPARSPFQFPGLSLNMFERQDETADSNKRLLFSLNKSFNQFSPIHPKRKNKWEDLNGSDKENVGAKRMRN